MTHAAELRRIDALSRHFLRSADQANSRHESDAEIIPIPGGYLALTCDTVAEEGESGLYRDPHLLGWVAVVASLSDLAAVAARPLGILVAETLPPSPFDAFVDALQRGIADACDAHGTAVLGGDTNEGSQLSLTVTAAGTCDSKPLCRSGAAAGDVLYSTGRLGRGNAFAFNAATQTRQTLDYAPIARLREASTIRRFASACMDTSDGAIATLDQLMLVNGCGFLLDASWNDALDSDGAALFERHGLPPWLLLAGCHGEYELLFTVPAEKNGSFLEAAASDGWPPMRLGTVSVQSACLLPLDEKRYAIDTTYLRDLGFLEYRTPASYIGKLLEYDDHLRKGAYHHV